MTCLAVSASPLAVVYFAVRTAWLEGKLAETELENERIGISAGSNQWCLEGDDRGKGVGTVPMG